MVEKFNFRSEELTFTSFENKLTIKKASNNSLISAIIFGVFSLSTIDSIYLLIEGKNNIACFIMLVVGVCCFRRFLWELKGFEIIEIDKNYLHIKKKGSFLMFNKKYELVKIKNINYKHEAYKNFSNIGLNLSELISLYINIIGFGSGDILFKYGYQTISFFHGLNIIEKGKVVNEINLKLSLKNKKA